MTEGNEPDAADGRAVILHPRADYDVSSQPPIRLIYVLSLTTAIAPFAIDAYLTALPTMARDFGVTTSEIQLTLTAFLVGLAAGQLVIGPLSDSIGRRTPLIVGTMICVLASIGCALAPTIEVLIAARFVQGTAGAAGAVLSRAVITDRTHGDVTAKYFSLLLVITGVAPVVAPVIGSGILEWVGWRGILWVITILAVFGCVGVVTRVPESLPEAQRRSRGVRQLARVIRGVVGNRAFAGYAATFALAFMTMFAWISASSFVLQNDLGLSTGWYAVVIGINAVALLGSNLVNSRVVGRFGARRMVRAGLTVMGAASVAMAVNVASGTILWPTLIISFAILVSIGLIMGNCAALAIGEVRHAAGIGSAVLGASQFSLGGAIAPVVGLAGNRSAVPLACAMLTTATLAVVCFAVAGRGARRSVATGAPEPVA